MFLILQLREKVSMGLINRQPSNGLKFHRKTSNNQFISVETWLEVVALHIRAVNRHLKKISDTVGRLVKQPQYYLSRQIGIVFFTLRPSKLGTPPPNPPLRPCLGKTEEAYINFNWAYHNSF